MIMFQCDVCEIKGPGGYEVISNYNFDRKKKQYTKAEIL